MEDGTDGTMVANHLQLWVKNSDRWSGKMQARLDLVSSPLVHGSIHGSSPPAPPPHGPFTVAGEPRYRVHMHCVCCSTMRTCRDRQVRLYHVTSLHYHVSPIALWEVNFHR